MFVALALLFAAAFLPAVARSDAGFTFTPDPAQPSLPSGSNLVTVADANGDGKPDLIVADPVADTLGVMLGNGAGDFGQPNSISLGGKPLLIHVADFNGDGHPDLLVPLEVTTPPTPQSNPLPDHVQILYGDGQGNFTVGPETALPERGPVYVGDFTGSGNADVVVVPDGCFGGNNTARYYMLLGDGHGALTAGPLTTSETNGCGYQVGDFNGDGRDDLVTFSQGGVGGSDSIVVLPGQPNGGFGAPLLTSAPANSFHVEQGAADLDGNGTLDLVMSLFTEPSTFDVLNGTGTGGFATSGPYSSGAPHLSFVSALGDFSGDGHVDIAAIASQIEVLDNNGAGVFSAGLVVPLAQSFSEAFVADVNGDGRPDLILSGVSGTEILLDEPAPPPANVIAKRKPLLLHKRHAALVVSGRFSRRVRKGKVSLQVRGELILEKGLHTSHAVCAGRVLTRVRYRGKTLHRKRVNMASDCAFRETLRIEAHDLRRHMKLSLIFSFGGNSYLLPASIIISHSGLR